MFDLYNFQPEPPDLRCGQDVTILYGECQQAKCGTSVGMVCLWCRREVTDREWQDMSEPQMRVKGGMA